MAQVGAFKQIAWAKESTRGTVVAPATGSAIEHDGFDFEPKIEKVENKAAKGSIVGRNQAFISKEYSEGSIPMNTALSKIGDICNIVMGAVPSTTGSGPTYTHAYTLANTNNHLSYSFTVEDAVAGDKVYAGGMLNTFKLEAKVDDYIKLTLGIKASKEGTAASWTPSYTTADVFFKPTQINVYMATNYAGLGAALAMGIESINLNVNKNVKPYHILGSSFTVNNFNQRVTIDGDMTRLYSDTVQRVLGLAETSRAMKIVMSDGTYSWTITIPSMDLQAWTDAKDIEAYQMETYGFNANYLDTTNGFIKMDLVDNISSHA